MEYTNLHIAKRKASILFLVIIFIYFISCSDDNFNNIINQENAHNTTNQENPPNTIPNSTAPIPGNNGLIIVTNITENSAKLQWTLSTDNSPAQLLQYQVVISNTLTLFSLQEILQSGLLNENKWSNGPATEQTVTNLLFGKQYFVNVCVRDPDNNISIYNPATFTTIGRIYLFSAGTFTGAMASSAISARQDIDELIRKALLNDYPTLPKNNYVAFISINTLDSIKNLAFHYGIPTSWPIYSPSDRKIANSFYELLLKDDIGNSLQDFGVIVHGGGEGWWSGSTEYGDCAVTNCNGWTNDTNRSKGRLGKKNKTDKEWISSKDDNCNNTLHLLGLCW